MIWHNYKNQSELEYKTEKPFSIHESINVGENNYRDDESHISKMSRRSHLSNSIPEKVSLAGIKIKELFFKKH